MNEDEVVGTGQSTEMLQSQNAISAQEAQGATTMAANNVLQQNAGQSNMLGAQNTQFQTAGNFQYDPTRFDTGNYGNYASGVQGLYQQQWNNYNQAAQNAYDMNRQDLLDYQANVPKPYQQQANQLGVQQEQNQKNYNMYAQYNGINTGSASQSALAMQNTYAQQQANIATARANAEKDAQKAVVNLETQYRNQLAEALGNYEFQFAQQIFGLMQDQDSYKQQVAPIYAQYGDFTMYEDLGYSDNVINGMKLDYLLTNPQGANAQEIATELVNSGSMSEKEIYDQTGISVNGYSPPSSGGNFYTSWYWTEYLGNDAVYGADGKGAGGYSAEKSNAFKNGNYNVGGTSYVAKDKNGNITGSGTNSPNAQNTRTEHNDYSAISDQMSAKLNSTYEEMRRSGKYSEQELEQFFMNDKSARELQEQRAQAENASGNIISYWESLNKNSPVTTGSGKNAKSYIPDDARVSEARNAQITAQNNFDFNNAYSAMDNLGYRKEELSQASNNANERMNTWENIITSMGYSKEDYDNMTFSEMQKNVQQHQAFAENDAANTEQYSRFTSIENQLANMAAATGAKAGSKAYEAALAEAFDRLPNKITVTDVNGNEIVIDSYEEFKKYRDEANFIFNTENSFSANVDGRTFSNYGEFLAFMKNAINPMSSVKMNWLSNNPTGDYYNENSFGENFGKEMHDIFGTADPEQISKLLNNAWEAYQYYSGNSNEEPTKEQKAAYELISQNAKNKPYEGVYNGRYFDRSNAYSDLADPYTLSLMNQNYSGSDYEDMYQETLGRSVASGLSREETYELMDALDRYNYDVNHNRILYRHQGPNSSGEYQNPERVQEWVDFFNEKYGISDIREFNQNRLNFIARDMENTKDKNEFGGAYAALANNPLG